MPMEPAVCRLWKNDESWRHAAIKAAQDEDWLIRAIRAAGRQRPKDKEAIGLANKRLQEIRKNPPEVNQ